MAPGKITRTDYEYLSRPESGILRSMTDTRRTVLVIDDEESVRDVLSRFLTKAGYEVQIARDGQEALQIVHSKKAPDVIILDLIMAGMSGFEVLSALRVVPEWSTIPVVVLTGTMGYSAAHLQADALLMKPFTFAAVQAAIEAAMARHK
jgi:CheY-like chemotaxis protein